MEKPKKSKKVEKNQKPEITSQVENAEPVVLDRNGRILECIEFARIPILPFELELAKNALQNHIKKQNELGKLMREAMTQSSETWHDNAPADVICGESKVLAQTAEQPNKVINFGEVFDYETNLEAGATLGSLVGVRYDEWDEYINLYLTGSTHVLPPEILETITKPDIETQVITLSGPMGKQILGKQSGDRFNLILENDRKMPITVMSVEHIKIEG